MKKNPHLSRASTRLGLLIALVMVVLYSRFPLSSLEWRAYDLRLEYSPTFVKDPPVTLVTIDDASLAALGRWPWPRDTHARLIEALNAAGAKVIVLDIEFPEPSPDPALDARLAEAARRAGNVVVGAHGRLEPSATPGRITAQEFGKPVEPIASAVGVGHINAVSETDGVVRKSIAVIASPEEVLPSIDLVAVARYLGTPPPSWDGRSRVMEWAGHSIPMDPWGRFLVDFSAVRVREINGGYYADLGADRPVFPIISYVDVLNGDFDPAEVRDRIVFVSPWAASLTDLHTFPLLGIQKPGGLLHAYTMQTLLQGSFPKPVPRPVNQAAVFLAAFLPSLLFFRLSPGRGTLLMALLVLGNAAFNLYLMSASRILLDLVHPSLAIVLAYLGNLAQRIVIEQRDRLRITGMFQRYVGPEVVKEILAAGEEALRLGGTRRPVTVLFLDVRGFTPLAEKLEPEEVVDILNRNFEMITQVIFKYGGTLDKFIGDAVMAVFNSPLDLPDHPLQAVLAAREIQERAREIRQALEAKYGRSVQFGIGVNTGEAVCGNIGSSKRMEFTAIGDAVNLAARLESNAKPGQVLISEAVWRAVKDRVDTEPVGPITVKGKSEPVNVYAVKIPAGDSPGR